MATRSSARITAAKARSRTGNAKSTRSSDRIAKINQSSGSNRSQQAAKGGLAKESMSRQLRTKKMGATRVPRTEGENEQRLQDANEPNFPARVFDVPGHRMPAYYGGREIAFPLDRSLPHPRSPADEELPDYDDQGADDAPDEGDAHANPSVERYNEGPFLETLLRNVTTQRALRRKREALRTCHQDIRDAEFMVENYQIGTTFRNPTTGAEWDMHNAILRKVAEWQTELSAQQDLENGLKYQIECLESRAEKQCSRDEELSRLSQESQRLHFLSTNQDFWEPFHRWQATTRSLVESGPDLRQSEHVKGALDIEMDIGCMRNLGLTARDPSSFSVAREEAAYQDISRAPVIYQKHVLLQQKEQAARKMQTEQWMHLLGLAEDAFVQAGVLEMAAERQEGEGERGSAEQQGHEQEKPEPELEPEPAPVQKADSEVMKDGVRERLQATLEICRKARDDFEDARNFSKEEIEQLPQPVTEDYLGAARALKLGRLTHALHNAEKEYDDAKKAARDAGVEKPQAQTADFSDHSDDGYAASLLGKTVVQARERVSRVQGWTGLHLKAQEMSEEVQTVLPKSFQSLKSVRLGEDSFDLTEASGRDRERIDAMEVESESLRATGGLPKADRDPLVSLTMRCEGT